MQSAALSMVSLAAMTVSFAASSEAYDKVASNFISAKDRLAKILSAKDKKATVSMPNCDGSVLLDYVVHVTQVKPCILATQILDMAGENQLDRSLLALLDQNIAAANSAGQVHSHQHQLAQGKHFLACMHITHGPEPVFVCGCVRGAQEQAAGFMEKIRGAVVKYMTV